MSWWAVDSSRVARARNESRHWMGPERALNAFPPASSGKAVFISTLPLAEQPNVGSSAGHQSFAAHWHWNLRTVLDLTLDLNLRLSNFLCVASSTVRLRTPTMRQQAQKRMWWTVWVLIVRCMATQKRRSTTMRQCMHKFSWPCSCSRNVDVYEANSGR
eukprot:3938385-Rhodomonas_salina.1